MKFNLKNTKNYRSNTQQEAKSILRGKVHNKFDLYNQTIIWETKFWKCMHTQDEQNANPTNLIDTVLIIKHSCLKVDKAKGLTYKDSNHFGRPLSQSELHIHTICIHGWGPSKQWKHGLHMQKLQNTVVQLLQWSSYQHKSGNKNSYQ
jgi:uncharacterized protein with ParB-like and HNH nuclease domain